MYIFLLINQYYTNSVGMLLKFIDLYVQKIDELCIYTLKIV